MPLYAAACRLRRGELAGGERGRELVAGAVARMLPEGIRRPERWARMLVPG